MNIEFGDNIFVLLYRWLSGIVDAIPFIESSLENLIPSAAAGLVGLPSTFIEFALRTLPIMVVLAVVRWIT